MPLSCCLRVFVLLWLCLPGSLAYAEPRFPELSGRVVDGADMLSPAAEQEISRRLASHEASAGQQLVVATFENLQGYSIETFGYQLARTWGIGQEGRDDGALLIVARQERALRIEVGYGLEGLLTDARSAQIINQIMSPAFKRGDFEGGISDAVQAMITLLEGGAITESPEARQGKKESPFGIVLFLWALFMFLGGRGGLLGGLVAGSVLGGHRRGGFGGGGFSGGGGGFSGGGGSFGGGGASGGW